MGLFEEEPSGIPETETAAKVNRIIISVVSVLVVIVVVCFVCEFKGILVRFKRLLVRLWDRFRKMIYTETSDGAGAFMTERVTTCTAF